MTVWSAITPIDAHVNVGVGQVIVRFCIVLSRENVNSFIFPIVLHIIVLAPMPPAPKNV